MMNATNLLLQIEKTIEYNFRNPLLLLDAITHRSYITFQEEKGEEIISGTYHDYEKLEFLGDRVLGLIVANKIFRDFSKNTEGELVLLFSYLTNQEYLVYIGQKLKLEELIRAVNYPSHKNKELQDRPSQRVLSDVMEAIIGAMFIDSNLETVEKFILKHWDFAVIVTKDPKTQLQELCHKNGWPTPDYIYKNHHKDGGDYFHATVIIRDRKKKILHQIQAQANSKHKSSSQAAKLALDTINNKVE